jgi:hypothetical protein
MTIDKGFKLDKPDIFVPWGIDETMLQERFKNAKLKNVTTGYYTTSAESLGGLKCQIGFHFEPRQGGRLKELEFFKLDNKNQQKSFDEFQMYFVKEFRLPTKTVPGTEGFQKHEWKIGTIQIVHYIIDRFGPEEHMRIRHLS